MPVENEIKYVLFAEDPDSLEEKFESSNFKKYLINQVYLSDEARIRKMTSVKKGKPEFNFTFKRKIGKVNVEIEKKISEDDFHMLYETKVDSLFKVRYKWQYSDTGDEWVVDFFKDEVNRTYFILVECEMVNPRQSKPKLVPELISQHILYEVPRIKSTICSSKKLANIQYAQQLLAELMVNKDA